MNIERRINALRGAGPVRVVSAPQLFPTPAAICEKMIDYLDLFPDCRVLEPSAGTGNIIKALLNRQDFDRGDLIAVEINHQLVNDIDRSYPEVMTTQRDFLEWEAFEPFDCIVMNPPFKNGDDIKHILHAKDMLAEGGTLVALCANGSRQQKQLMSIADHWEELPQGSFKSEGTNVNTALLVIRGRA